ncbi:MAG: MBL fold metallo-hydrolase, partial [Rhodospirillaceae bacterium]
GQFSWGPATVTLMPTLHLLAEDGSEMLSYGLMIQGPNRLAYLTTDTRPNEEVMLPRYTQADLVFQDCETASTASGAHSHYTELAKLPAAAKAKMWLYHYQDGAKPDCLEDGFLGWVQPGQGFEL